MSKEQPSFKFPKNKDANVKLAKNTLEIVANKKYTTKNGQKVDLSPYLLKMKSLTYSDDFDWSSVKIKGLYDTKFEVRVEKSLAGCRRKIQELGEDMKVGCLNFASAKNPGGGFTWGTMAQEESIAYSSGLYEAIKDSPMYAFNLQDLRNGLYSDYMIASESVPVFRDDSWQLLEEPYVVTFLTSPAVKCGKARVAGIDESVIDATMRQRADKILSMAVRHQIDVLVLGSWGCGVFAGDIHKVSHMFVELLTNKYKNVFREVVFSTTDPNHEEVFLSELVKAKVNLCV